MKIEVVGGMKKKKRPKRKVEKGKRAEFGAMHAILEPAAEIIDETVKGPGTQDQWNPSDMLSAGFWACSPCFAASRRGRPKSRERVVRHRFCTCCEIFTCIKARTN